MTDKGHLTRYYCPDCEEEKELDGMKDPSAGPHQCEDCEAILEEYDTPTDYMIEALNRENSED